jgi:hypothetical protein
VAVLPALVGVVGETLLPPSGVALHAPSARINPA